jgi:hypothetical protein
MGDKKQYALDPVSIQLYDSTKLTEIIIELSQEAGALTSDNSIEIANKVVILSDVQTIIVELLSRYELNFENSKLTADAKQAVATKKHREDWEAEHPGEGKFPASKYFENLAKQDTLKLWREVNADKSMLSKFKGFRNNYETKINALKKLLSSLEAIRY